MIALRAYQRAADNRRDDGLSTDLFDTALLILKDLPVWLAYAYSNSCADDDAPLGGEYDTMTPVNGYTEAITWLVMMARDYGGGPFSRLDDHSGHIPTPFTGPYYGYVDDPTTVAGMRPVFLDEYVARCLGGRGAPGQAPRFKPL
jgi:hypothetical protein